MPAGRSSRRSILVVAGVAVLMAGGGFLAASLVISPEDAAARTAAPAAGPITVAVDKKALDANIVTRGDIGFTGSVEVKLADGGTTGAAVITGRIPEVGSVVSNGTVLLEVTGRPVLALSGDLPTYRTLVSGSTGPDVEQLETILAALGFDPGPQDKLYDAATGAAVTQLYQSLGYEAPQPTEDVKAALSQAEAGVTAADLAVTDAQAALDTAKKGPSQSERLQLQAAIDQAQAAYNEAKVTPTPPDPAAVEKASRDLEAATNRLAAAQTEFDNATEANYTAKQSTRDLAQDAVDSAAAALEAANQNGPPSQSAIAAAKSALEIAKATRDEALNVDTTIQEATLTTAQQVATTAQADLAAARAAATTPLPAQEVVWLAGMPRRVDEVLVVRGSVIDGAVLKVSGADLSVKAKVSADEAGLLKVGLTAELTVPGSAALPAVISKIGDPSDDTTGTSVILQPQNVSNEQAQALRGANVKVTIPVASTSGEVLVVPVAGLFSDAGGTPRVEVLLADGSTRFQPVQLGLSTGGEVEVRPIDEQGNVLQPASATLDTGSLVVVGR